MYKTDKIAIIMATYNGEKYISEQIESLLGQSCTDWELFIHDDGSKDNTVDIIKAYENKYPEKIHVIDAPPTGGAKNNFFFLMRNVDAPYIMCCDQDDVWLEKKIESTFHAMRRLEEENGCEMPFLVFTDLKVVDEKLNVICEKMSLYQRLDLSRIRFSDLMNQNVVTGCTMMINRALNKMVFRLEDFSSVIMHDWWCALIAAYFGKLVALEESTILYRQHGDNSVGAQNPHTLEYVKRKLSNIGKIKESLYNAKRQVGCFVDTYPVNKADESLKFSKLRYLSKIKRMYFYANGGRKQGRSLKKISSGLIWIEHNVSAKENVRLAACVILYNPDSDVIFNIESYINEVDVLYVVNNGGAANIIDLLIKKYDNVCVIGDGVNQGISKPLNEVLKLIYGKYEFLMTMDQDSKFCNEQMKQYKDCVGLLTWDNIIGIGPRIVENDIVITKEKKSCFKVVKRMITSGNVIDVKKAVAVGGFDENLFIDEVDHEFCYRARLEGYDVLECEQGVSLKHSLGNLIHRFILYRNFGFMQHSWFRKYYIVRNRLYVWEKYHRCDEKFFFRYYVVATLRMLIDILFFEDDKCRKLKAYYLGVRDYFDERMGKASFLK